MAAGAGEVTELSRRMAQARSWAELLELAQAIWQYPVLPEVAGKPSCRSLLCAAYAEAVRQRWGLREPMAGQQPLSAREAA